MFWIKNKTIYPCSPYFQYMKVEYEGVFNSQMCFSDVIFIQALQNRQGLFFMITLQILLLTTNFVRDYFTGHSGEHQHHR